MAINNRQKIEDAIGQGNMAVALREIAAAIDEGDNSQAAAVAAIGATANLVAPTLISDAAPLAGTESRLDALEAKVDAILAAIKAAGQMAP